MNEQEILTRFEELEAGRILGDLDQDEIKEWEELSQNPHCDTDLSLELAAAALDAEFLQGSEDPLPEHLLKELQTGMDDFIVPEDLPEEKVISLPEPQRSSVSPWPGWAVAAALALLMVVTSLTGPPKESSAPGSSAQNKPEKAPTPEKARDALRTKATDLLVSSFGGVETYDKMSGDVVWSDELQEGYMTLTNLPANDPEKKQYQLWIVDPERDEKPVDGGVFNIPSGQTTAVIPIRNPLAVKDPKAFVITLEQAGGVVVSKQEEVVALAKSS